VVTDQLTTTENYTYWEWSASMQRMAVVVRF